MTQRTRFPSNGTTHPVADTAISSLDGELRYRGYSVEELVDHASFLEVAYLVVHGELPYREQLADMEATLLEAASLDSDLIDHLERIPLNVPMIDVVRTSIDFLAMTDAWDEDAHPKTAWETLVTLLGQIPLITSARSRITVGQDLLEYRHDLNYAGNLVWLLTGKEPSLAAERACNAFLILSAEHEFSPSTFAARIVASTRSDFHSAVIAGLCAVKGVWHGGPGRQVLDILDAVGEAQAASAIVSVVLDQYERMPGFWHRVYRTSDPRAELLTEYCRELSAETNHAKMEDVAAAIEAAVWEKQQILPCLDWPAARLLHYLGLDGDLLVSTFAISRMVGWAAHFIEQHESPHLIRPRATYVGVPRRSYQSIEERG